MLARGTPRAKAPGRPWEKSPSGMPIFFSMSKGTYSLLAMTFSRVMLGAYLTHRSRKRLLYVARTSSHSAGLRADALGKKNQPFMACLPGGAWAGGQRGVTQVP